MRGLKTDGSWNCGLLFWRPHVVQPVTPCSVSPPAKRGSVGRPVMPYSSSIVGPPTPGGSLPASVRDTAEADFEQRARGRRVGDAAGDLLVQHVHERVARAAGRAGDRRRLEVVDLAVAHPHERGHPGAELVIDLHVELVVEVRRVAAASRSCWRCPGSVGRRQIGEDLPGERRDGARRESRRWRRPRRSAGSGSACRGFPGAAPASGCWRTSASCEICRKPS